MTRKRTRSEIEIEARLEALEPNTPRAQLLCAARDFRASWVALGERLTQVRERSLFREWGYSDFELYCRRELRLRGDTADKLTRSFAYLRDHQPKVLHGRAAGQEVPPLDVVALLSQARDRTQVSEADLQQIQQEVFAGAAQPTRQQVVKRFREVDPEAFKGPPRAAAAAGQEAAVVGVVGENDLRKALLLAERLQSLLELQGDFSTEAVRGVRAAVAELRRRFNSGRGADSQESHAA